MFSRVNPTHIPTDGEVDAERQELRPPARRIEHFRRQYLIDRFAGMPQKGPEILRPGRPSALPLPVVRKRRLHEPARRHREQGLARSMIVRERPKQHPSRLAEILSARLREGAAFNHHARNRKIAVRHRRLPSLLIRPGPGARAHPGPAFAVHRLRHRPAKAPRARHGDAPSTAVLALLIPRKPAIIKCPSVCPFTLAAR